jgi:hypothetical protein
MSAIFLFLWFTRNDAVFIETSTPLFTGYFEVELLGKKKLNPQGKTVL